MDPLKASLDQYKNFELVFIQIGGLEPGLWNLQDLNFFVDVARFVAFFFFYKNWTHFSDVIGQIKREIKIHRYTTMNNGFFTNSMSTLNLHRRFIRSWAFYDDTERI